ncbi:MAG: carboxylating nicotinate-nucleotide diphosphorylase [Agarilytica sp.]
MNITLDDIKDDITRSVNIALEEDVGSGDITAQLIPADKADTARIITREDCVICGTAWVDETYRQLDDSISIDWQVKDGDSVKAGSTLVTLSGNSRALLTGERTALNFLQLLSGTATKANEFAQALGDSHIKLLDTRKTIPGLRTAQKYAVATGGCHNHRIGLFDAYLIKENHIAACGSIENAIKTAREHNPGKIVEIEVESIPELKKAVSASADIVMLDNFDNHILSNIKEIDKRKSKYELSGNIIIDDVIHYNRFNIDYISIGALTKNVDAIDLSMKII